MGPQEWIIIAIVALLLFGGGARLAGIGRGAGRSIREFKEEVKGIDADKAKTEVVDAEIVPTPVQDPAAGVIGADLAARQRELDEREAAIRQRALDEREAALSSQAEELRRQREANGL